MDSQGKIQTSGSLGSMTNIWSNAYRHGVTRVLHAPAQVVHNENAVHDAECFELGRTRHVHHT